MYRKFLPGLLYFLQYKLKSSRMSLIAVTKMGWISWGCPKPLSSPALHFRLLHDVDRALLSHATQRISLLKHIHILPGNTIHADPLSS